MMVQLDTLIERPQEERKDLARNREETTLGREYGNGARNISDAIKGKAIPVTGRRGQ
jgi:hypothetical protein